MVYFLVIIGVTGVLLTLRALFLRLWFVIYEKKESAVFEPRELDDAEVLIDSTLNRLTYYKNLSEKGKQRFITRTKKVVGRLTFSTEGNIEADDEKKILIVASIIQITFGL